MMKLEHVLCLLLSCFFLHKSDCRSYLDQGCLCPSRLKYDCPEDGYLPLGESAYIDFGTQKCTCISPNNIECRSICPDISPTCKYIGRPMDGCGMCACPVEDHHFIGAGEFIEKECEICKCPPEGGELQCTKNC